MLLLSPLSQAIRFRGDDCDEAVANEDEDNEYGDDNDDDGDEEDEDGEVMLNMVMHMAMKNR